MGATWSREYRDFLGEGGDRSGNAARGAWLERSRLFDRAARIASPEALLARVWSVPGTLHPAIRAGIIEEGALANVVVWDADHPSMWPEAGLSTLAMGDTTQAIHAMFVAGREVGEAGDFHRSLLESERYREASGEANRRREALLAKR